MKQQQQHDPVETHKLALAHHSYPAAQCLEHPIRSRMVASSIHIWDSDFFFSVLLNLTCNVMMLVLLFQNYAGIIRQTLRIFRELRLRFCFFFNFEPCNKEISDPKIKAKSNFLVAK